LSKLRGLRWETGAVLPEGIQQGTLSSRELDYFSEFSDILNNYNSAVGFDLTEDLEPPKKLFIEVLALEDCGEIQTSSGPVSLNKGMRHFLRR
jgi:hypothetical protein